MFENFYLDIQLLSEDSKMPTRANYGDAGMDVYTPIDISIPPLGDILVPLDFRVEFPEGYVMIVKEKSGIATKKKLSVGASVIDSAYRGNCHCHLFNHSNDTILFEKGQKIAQLLILPTWSGNPIQVDFINTDTERGVSGFGSTGDK